MSRGRGQAGDAGSRLASRLRLMVLTHPRPAAGPLPDVVGRCLAAGATAVQLRDPEATDAELFEAAQRLRPVAREHDALFLVNDRAHVALAAGADGVHLGPDDLPVAAVRGFVPGDFVIGYSTDDPDEARAAARDGADYLGVGAVYGTRSKAGLEEEAIGPERVAQVLEAAGLPGVGIGGITPENASGVTRSGAGIAVLSAVMLSEDPAGTVERLLDAEPAA